jgi:hypothetical protein
VEISAAANRSGQNDTSGVRRLPSVLEIHSSSDFFDQNGSEALGSVLIVKTDVIMMRIVIQVQVQVQVYGANVLDEEDE